MLDYLKAILPTHTRSAQSYAQLAADGQLQTRDLTTRDYKLRSDTVREKDRSVEAVIATENRVTVLDWNRFELIDEVLLMDGLQLDDDRQVPLLDTHNRATVRNQLGSTRDMKVQGSQLIGRNYFSASAEAEHPWTLTKEKHLRDNSIGYQVLESALIEPGESGQVAGKKYTAGANRALRVVTGWKVKENSVCPVGADSAAKNRKQSTERFNKERKMDFEQWLQARGIDINDLDDTKRAELEKEFEAEQNKSKNQQTPPKKTEQRNEPADHKDARREPPGEPEPEDPEAAAQRVLTAERNRITQIRKLAGTDIDEATVRQAVDQGWSIEKAQGVFLEKIRESRVPVKAPGGIVRDNELTADMMTAGMLLRAGFEDAVVKGRWGGDYAGNGEKLAEQADKFRDMSLLDLCRHAVTAETGSAPTKRDDLIRAGFSTVSLPTILGNIANKSLLKGYGAGRTTWRSWCGTDSVPDFKEKAAVRMTDTGDLEKVTNTGQVKYGAASEETEKYQVGTYAKNFSVSRQNLINDDIGAITRHPERMGMRAARLPEKMVYQHLIDNDAMADSIALFHSDHDNLNTSNALVLANLETAITDFTKQKDADGQKIDIEPRYLIVPAALRINAEKLTGSQKVQSGQDAPGTPELNVISNFGITVVWTSKLDDDSATSWYMAANPALVDTIIVAFLNGRQEPTLERFAMGPDYMGVTFRVMLDCGVKAVDWRGLQKNTA